MECNYVIEWYVDHPLSVGWHNKLSHPAGNINLALFSLDAHVAKKKPCCCVSYGIVV